MKDALTQAMTLAENVNRLAALPTLEYDRIRKEEAERLNVRVGTLDAEVAKIRKAEKADAGESALFPEVEPWAEVVDGALLLHEIVSIVKRFIICEPETLTATALWCAFTWLIDKAQVAPLAVITAPEMRCGKTQLLNVIGKLSYRPLQASSITPPAMFRVIEAYHPTLLIDEADTFFNANEELRGVVNSGHTRQSAFVIRTVGDDHTPTQFSTWGAKAISGIGSLPNTVRDRAILLELRRKLPSESVERLRHSENGIFERLASQLARFSLDAGDSIEKMKPELPEVLNDRAQDNWEPLLAIADYVGGGWPEMARKAAITLSGIEQEPASVAAELLADIQEVFDTKRVEKIGSADLILALMEDDTKSWATYNRGQPITPRQLAKRLNEYKISSKNVKIGYECKKGFDRSQFDDAFARYLTPSPPNPEISATPLPKPGNQVNTGVSMVADSKAGSATINPSATVKTAENLESSGVADNSPFTEEDIREVVLM